MWPVCVLLSPAGFYGAGSMISDWKPPRRNGHYICIGGQTHPLAEWSRRCGISTANLLHYKRFHGEFAMIRRIKAGLRGEYKASTGGACHKNDD
jgi:hypothetical protein